MICGLREVSLLIVFVLTLLTKPTAMRTGEKCYKLMTAHAKGVVQEAIASGQYADRIGGLEPPVMAPSTNPDLYSSVSIHAIR